MNKTNLSKLQIIIKSVCPWLKLVAVTVLAAAIAFPFAIPAQEPAASAKSTEPSELEINDGVLVWNSPVKTDKERKPRATLKNLVELLREQHPDANFVLSPGLDHIEVSDLKLRNADVEEKLQALCIASGGMVGWRDENGAVPGGVDPATGFPIPSERRSDKPMFVFFATGIPASAEPKLQVEAFNISGYLDAVRATVIPKLGVSDPAEMDSRVAQALDEVERMASETMQRYRDLRTDLTRGKSPALKMPSIRFHQGANLCVIIGEPEAVAVVGKVIGALPGAQRSVAAEPFADPFGRGAGISEPGGRYGIDPGLGGMPRR